MQGRWIRRRRASLGILAAVGGIAAVTLSLILTRPGADIQSTGEQALSREPHASLVDNYLAQIHAGTAAFRAQRFTEAMQAFGTATTLQPSESLPYRYLAELYWRAGRQEQAVQAVRSLAAVMPEAYFLDQVGRTYEEAGLQGLAMHVYQEAVRIDRHFPGVRYNLGRVYLEAGELERGIAEMHEVLRLHQEFPEAHQALGMAYSEQGRFEAAILHLKQALALDPQLTVVRNFLGRLYLAQGHLAEAIQTFRILVERAPDVPEARHNLAVAYARQGLQGLAIDQFSEALRLRPDFHAARLDLATLLLENGRAADAIATLEAALTSTSPQLEPDDRLALVQIRYRLGLAYLMAGRRQEAIRELETVLQAQPTHAAAHATLGRLYYQLRQFAQAWRHARRAESLGLPVAELLAALRQVAVEPP